MQLKMTSDEIVALLDEVFPQIQQAFRITALSAGTATVELEVGDEALRPGGTVSGPTLFTLADLSFYVATLAVIGPQHLAVTTNLSITFMRKAVKGRLWADARVLKLGRTLSMGDVLLYSGDGGAPIAQASVTYAIPRASTSSRGA